jgi:UDP-N-acetylmuramyl pentapeptide phosphotransferase/UDP-N-acetylglucosamine-1-phosphate transferase
VSPTPRASGPALAALTAAAVTGGLAAGQRVTQRWPRWIKRNFRDRDVTLVLGPAVGVGALMGLAAAGAPARRQALLAVTTAAAVGVYDDLYGSRHAAGLRGHGKELLQGRVTTGLVKLVAITGAAALGAGRQQRSAADALLSTVVVAGSANLVNLFDLRPGRAAKVTVAAAAALGCDRGVAGQIAAIAAGAALGALPADLGERAMLGDAGAGTLGALLGCAAAVSGTRRRRGMVAAAVVGLTLASERVSFSAVIERQPVLRALDRLGRPAS